MRFWSASLSALALAASFAWSAHAQEPTRIVSAGGSVTEILYALGAEKRIVGVDSTSLFPLEALRTKPNVGYLRALSAEGLLALQPDVILAAEGAGPADAIDLARKAGVRFVAFDEGHSPDSIRHKIEAIGDLVGRKDAATRLAHDVQAKFDALAAARAKIAEPRRALLLLGFQNGRAMAAGDGTAADAVMRLAGIVNAGAGMQGYKQLSDEAVVAAAPDIVVLAQRDGADASQDVFASPAFAATPAAADKRVIRMDALYLLGFGPRTPRAAMELMRAAYPEAQAAQ
jgi:iron complex transport system substrate-binding protein